MSAAASGPAVTGERDELLQALAEQRETFLIAVRKIGDAEAAARSTVSELTLGGLVKHLAQGNRAWAHIMLERAGTPHGMWDLGQYRMAEGDTLVGLLDEYAAAARAMEETVASLPDLGRMVPLPEAPWAPGIVDHWPVRRILLRVLRETAQHAGHADIIRESLDGANTTAQLGT